MRESTVEGRLRTLVQREGGMSFKLSPTLAGLPDRVVLYKGALYFVELKRPGGALSPIQRHRHKELRQHGMTVVVLSSTDEVTEWVTSITIGDTE